MLENTAAKLEAILEFSGRILGILPLLLILVQFAVVLTVYVFSSGNVQLQESLQYINALMFLGGAGYTAFRNEHVRVDIFYSSFSKKNQARVNFFGTVFLLIPFLVLFWATSLPYVTSSWAIFEKSVESSGLPFIYILKSTLLLFPLSLSLHAAVCLIRTFKTMRSS